MRGGFRSVTHGNPFLLHAFRARVATETVTEGFSITGEVDSGEIDQLTINAGAEEASAIFGAPGSLVTDNIGIIYVGANIPFDTIYFPFTGAFAGRAVHPDSLLHFTGMAQPGSRSLTLRIAHQPSLTPAAYKNL